MFETANILDSGWRAAEGEIWVWWHTDAPEGTTFQVYLNGALAWSGQSGEVVLPMPPGVPSLVQIGTVLDGEAATDFSADLPDPGGTGNRVKLTWEGGTYLAADDDVIRFDIFRSLAAGGAVDLTEPVGTVPAYPGGIVEDGWGVGPWGAGSWGRDAAVYTWISPPLPTGGTWAWRIYSVDSAGNLTNYSAASLALTVPPAAPARDASGKRLTVSYDPMTGQATLAWLASPG